MFGHVNIRVDGAEAVFLLQDDALFDPRAQVWRKLILKLIAGIDNQTPMHLVPVLLQVRVHARKRTIHRQSCFKNQFLGLVKNNLPNWHP
jgi:hypothetical protein